MFHVQVLLAVIKGAKGASRVSAYVMQDALLRFYTKHKLFPSGVYAEIPAVQSWALKYGLAIKKLATLRKFDQSFFFWDGAKFWHFLGGGAIKTCHHCCKFVHPLRFHDFGD